MASATLYTDFASNIYLEKGLELKQAFPLEGTPQGGLSCRCAAIHLQVAVALRLTDEGTARSAANTTLPPFLPLTRTLISRLRRQLLPKGEAFIFLYLFTSI